MAPWGQMETHSWHSRHLAVSMTGALFSSLWERACAGQEAAAGQEWSRGHLEGSILIGIRNITTEFRRLQLKFHDDRYGRLLVGLPHRIVAENLLDQTVRQTGGISQHIAPDIVGVNYCRTFELLR